MARPKFLYKYASLEKPEYFLDTLVNSHIYAGAFTEMNDPMEGAFKLEYNDPFILKTVLRDKLSHRFCALTTSPFLTLMWSYYAKEHTGYCLEIDVEAEKDADLVKIDYSNEIPLIVSSDGDNAKEILSHKFTDWAHEDEWRRFVEIDHADPDKPCYWEHVKINKVFFGSKVSNDVYERYKERIERELKIETCKVTREDLDAHHIDTRNKL